MAKLDWMRELDEADLKQLLDRDMKLVYEYCKLDTLIDLLENIPRISLYTSMRSVERARKFYILEHFTGDNHKELAAKLHCSQQFVYETLQDARRQREKNEEPDLFATVNK